MTESAGFLSSLGKKLAGDAYDRKARLYPCVLLLAPVAVLVGAFVSFELKAIESLSAAVVTLGGSFFLIQLAADRGKQKEEALFAEWGGMPSVAILRHRDPRIDPITKARLHARLTKAVTGTKAPTPAAETSNTKEADHVYSSWCYHLRTNTRDTGKFPLIFRENISYGYRRNLWGLRPFGLGISLLSCGFVVAYQVLWKHFFELRSSGAFIFSMIMLLFWYFRVTPSWIRIAADAYSARLIEATETIPLSKTKVAAASKKSKPPKAKTSSEV